MSGSGTQDDPWRLSTPPGASGYPMWRDDENDPPRLVYEVGSTTLHYDARVIDDLHRWLQQQGDWVPLGAADEKATANDGTVEARGRAQDTPLGGWCGLRSGDRARVGMYLPPLLEELGPAEVEHNARNNRMRPR